MTTTYIGFITALVAFILGLFCKKCQKYNNSLIPIQNLLVGVIVATIEWIITKDFKTLIAISGLVAGGTYDIIKNLKLLLNI